MCAQWDSLCNPLLLLYKILVFDFIGAIYLGAVLGLNGPYFRFPDRVDEIRSKNILMIVSEQAM